MLNYKTQLYTTMLHAIHVYAIYVWWKSLMEISTCSVETNWLRQSINWWDNLLIGTYTIKNNQPDITLQCGALEHVQNNCAIIVKTTYFWINIPRLMIPIHPPHLYDVYHHTVILESLMYIIIHVHFYVYDVYRHTDTLITWPSPHSSPS
jgi:hypothetical protein